MHIQYHEDPLLEHLADIVPSRPVRRDADPLNAFLQRRPFPASQPRRTGFWTTNDRSQRPLIRIDAQPTEQEHSQRDTGRTHHQIETALYVVPVVDVIHQGVVKLQSWLVWVVLCS